MRILRADSLSAIAGWNVGKGMFLGVLGPLIAEANGFSIVPNAEHPRRVLAALLLRSNAVVSVDDLTEELWAGSPPPSSITAVQTYVSKIRKGIAAGLGILPREVARDVLVTRSKGYVLRLASDELDLDRFERLSRSGRRALAQGSVETGAEILHGALSLWRGPALCDLERGPVLEAEIVRLDLSWLAAIEQRVDADMRLGRHYDVIGELAVLTKRYQLNETLHLQYMAALHGAGMRYQALALYHELRDRLDAELGLEPTLSVERAHRAILRGELVSAAEILDVAAAVNY